METQTQKQELINWISSIEDVEVLRKLINLKAHNTFNFDQEQSDSELAEQFKRGISSDEFRERTTEYIKSLPWKNKFIL
jgi:hypothetical protein